MSPQLNYDISLPGMNGIDLVRSLHHEYPFMWLLIVTGHNVDEYKTDSMEAGADAIVSKACLNDIYATASL